MRADRTRIATVRGSSNLDSLFSILRAGGVGSGGQTAPAKLVNFRGVAPSQWQDHEHPQRTTLEQPTRGVHLKRKKKEKKKSKVNCSHWQKWKVQNRYRKGWIFISLCVILLHNMVKNQSHPPYRLPQHFTISSTFMTNVGQMMKWHKECVFITLGWGDFCPLDLHGTFHIHLSPSKFEIATLSFESVRVE